MAYDSRYERAPNVATNRNTGAEMLQTLGIVGVLGGVFLAIFGTGSLATTIHALNKGISTYSGEDRFSINFDADGMELAGLGLVGVILVGSIFSMLHSLTKYKV